MGNLNKFDSMSTELFIWEIYKQPSIHLNDCVNLSCTYVLKMLCYKAKIIVKGYQINQTVIMLISHINQSTESTDGNDVALTSHFNSATTIYLSYSYNPVATNTNL